MATGLTALPMAVAIIMCFIHEVPCQGGLPTGVKEKKEIVEPPVESRLNGSTSAPPVRAPSHNTSMSAQAIPVNIQHPGDRAEREANPILMNQSADLGAKQRGKFPLNIASAQKGKLRPKDAKLAKNKKGSTLMRQSGKVARRQEPIEPKENGVSDGEPTGITGVTVELGGEVTGNSGVRIESGNSSVSRTPEKAKSTTKIIVINPWVLFEPTCTQAGGTCVDIDRCRSLDFRSQVPKCRHGRMVCCNTVHGGEFDFSKK